MYGIGIDIGGTKTSIVLGNAKGHLLEKRVIPTPHGKGAAKKLQILGSIVRELLHKRKIPLKKIKGSGVGVPGLYHGEKGVILQSPNMRDWIGMPLKKHLNKILPRPVRIDNDANATVVAEKLFGVAKNKKTFIYITVSTGIGSGVIVDGKLIKGVSFSAGEIGQQIVCPEDTWKNNVGVSGTLENVASGSSIARIATNRAKINKSKLNPLLKQRKITSKDVKDAALKGDRVARSVLLDAGKYLGMGLSNLIMILNPELIILGGGVLCDKGSDIIFQSMKKAIRSHTWPEPRKACIVIKTRSLDKIADLGALSLVFQD